MCNIYDVWIDKADLTYLQRWLDSPKEMTRRLLKILVGLENLIGMCARGKSKKHARNQKIFSVLLNVRNDKIKSEITKLQVDNNYCFQIISTKNVRQG